MCRNYTNTQAHKYKYTNKQKTQIHKKDKYTNTQAHTYTNPQSHNHTNTQIHKHTNTPSLLVYKYCIYNSINTAFATNALNGTSENSFCVEYTTDIKYYINMLLTALASALDKSNS